MYKGVVQNGNKRASALGFPTLNITLDDPAITGIFVARVYVAGDVHPAVAFADQKRNLLEAHVLDASVDLYGREIEVELLKKIRESAVYDSDEALRAAIEQDAAAARAFFRAV
ncbi:MAG: riboflavin kinase [Candidatus Kaiserbacteria bacterium]|nr:MAG: riboflavin kinase [Candidatus Kaiserbacteria bacterium]